MCIATALAVASTVVSAVGGYAQSKAQEAQLRGQADMRDRQATLERISGGYEATRRQEQLKQLTGEQITANAADGGALSGSALDVIADSRREGMLDRAAAEYGSKLKALNLRTEARALRSAARQQRTAGYIGLASSAVKLGQNLYDAGAFGGGSNPWAAVKSRVGAG